MQKIIKNKQAMSVGRQGFSLIELMVVVAIVSIITLVTLVSMNALREKKAVETAAREVAAVVREAQIYALTGKDLTATSTTCSYDFSWINEAPDYSIGGCFNPARSYTLKNGVNFSSGAGTISFNVPFSMLSGSTRTITVKKGTSSTYNICVYASGIVKESLEACP